VGTALYTAPELSNAAIGKAVFYNQVRLIYLYFLLLHSVNLHTYYILQKVDIYSLGIIFFEMCHPPWETGMERVKTIASLRSPQITLPKDYTERGHPQQVINHKENSNTVIA
jgi:serine/threonine protein kinase